MKATLVRLASLIVLASLSSCTAVTEESDMEVYGMTGQTQAALNRHFQNAAMEFGVPAELLKSVSWAETQWDMVEGEIGTGDRPAAWGVMALRGEQLERGAKLAGLSADEVRTDPGSNIRAAAALLDSYAEELKLDRTRLGAWAPAVAKLSEIPDEEGLRYYVVNDVYGALREGRKLEIEGGEIALEIAPIDVTPDFESPADDTYKIAAGTTDFPSAIWRASPNYNSRPAGDIGKEAMVIIHTCEGGYSGCWGWLRNSAAQASAHYVVSESGGEVTQLVREASRAWHVAASYECSRNSNHDCWRNGYSTNHFTVGIELAGYASQTRPAGQIDKLARLVCDISRDQGIPRDRIHVLGHGQLQPWNRTDPGATFPWTTFINKVKSYCGDGGTTTPSAIVIDSNNAKNNTSVAKVDVSGNWKSSNATSGYYGTGYWFAATESVSDAAEFLFYLPKAETRTVDAWWTAGTNRSDAAPFVSFNASGKEVGRTYKDQRANGGKWVTLGTYAFSAGWNKVVLSRWANEGKVVIADAVRVR
ncbi:MAG TPA: N-acetylmuramoyl-L-alanine amidase [Polyangiaceae bacterium]|nr:N-acetylmuramoyl-L-alanine amidase [Polyangiaceae bacterium]